MPKPLIIVESPAKARTLERFLGRRYTVRASKGHLRDLPKSQIGVDVEHGFLPRYITIRGKGEILRELRESAKKASRVYLATDPDREGEAISWHLAQALGLAGAEKVRVVFHEVTREAVERALRAPRPIDDDLVEAQQARRILDRLVGYELSPLLWRKIRRGLSAGRVQSAAMRLIVDREEAVEGFTAEEYWTLEVALKTAAGEECRAAYVGSEEEENSFGGARIFDRDRMARIAEDIDGAREVTVTQVKERERRRRPAPPFTTSTLQQEASRRLGFPVRKTMSVVQALYEGEDVPGEGRVGLVTYIRTDSVRVGEGAKAEARQFIAEEWGEPYVLAGERTAKEAPLAQGAHEAIRPTSLGRRPETLKGVLRPDAQRLYQLIWDRFVASQMADARYAGVTVEFAAGVHKLRAVASKLTFAGFLKVYEESREREDDGDESKVAERLPDMSVEDRLAVGRVDRNQHFTQPLPRYTEASLVKTLEELGIGRPSTYAPIIDTLLTRQYVEREKKRLVPTSLGKLVVDLLRQYFPNIVDPEFTAGMETALDRVEDGSASGLNVLSGFYDGFHKDLQRADEAIGKVELPAEETDEKCPKCDRPMAVKYGRYGRFLACTGFPECRGTKPYQEPTGAVCPDCGKPVVARRTRKGRAFYGCSGYPECSFTTWYRPIGRKCPECEIGFLIARRQRGSTVWQCVREACSYVQDADPEENAK